MADEWYDEALPGHFHYLVGKAVSDCSSFCGMNKESSPTKRSSRCKLSGQLAIGRLRHIIYELQVRSFQISLVQYIKKNRKISIFATTDLNTAACKYDKQE